MKVIIDQRKEVEVSRNDFLNYVEVQESGEFNMFDPRAREMTDLSKEIWIAIISNYDALAKEYKN